MHSPFPGMDPFLEAPVYWADFHATFINYWREAISDALPENYDASIGERVYLIERDPKRHKLAFPDLAVTHSDRVDIETPARSKDVATLEPVTIPLTIHLIELDLLLDGRRLPLEQPLPPAGLRDEDRHWAKSMQRGSSK